MVSVYHCQSGRIFYGDFQPVVFALFLRHGLALFLRHGRLWRRSMSGPYSGAASFSWWPTGFWLLTPASHLPLMLKLVFSGLVEISIWSMDVLRWKDSSSWRYVLFSGVFSAPFSSLALSLGEEGGKPVWCVFFVGWGLMRHDKNSTRDVGCFFRSGLVWWA